MPTSTSERGFNGYADFKSTYGNRVRVYESSAAMAPHVWISIDPGEESASDQEVAHLNVEQAILLRDALTEWLDEIPERWENGEQFLPTKKEKENDD